MCNTMNVVFYAQSAEAQQSGQQIASLPNWSTDLNQLTPGGTIAIVAHDYELAAAEGRVIGFVNQDFPMIDFRVVLVVCNAASLTDGLLTSPAERIANAWQRPVHATTGAAYLDDNLDLTTDGIGVEVQPNSDITSQMENLSLDDDSSS